MTRPIEHLSLDDVLALATRLLGDPPPVADVGLLGSTVARPQIFVGGQDAYPTIWLKAAALLQSVVNDHALVDGNTRLGWLATAVFLEQRRQRRRSHQRRGLRPRRDRRFEPNDHRRDRRQARGPGPNGKLTGSHLAPPPGTPHASGDTDCAAPPHNLARQHDDVDAELTQTVYTTPAAQRSRPEIGAIVYGSKEPVTIDGGRTEIGAVISHAGDVGVPDALPTGRSEPMPVQPGRR